MKRLAQGHVFETRLQLLEFLIRSTCVSGLQMFFVKVKRGDNYSVYQCVESVKLRRSIDRLSIISCNFIFNTIE